MIRGNAVGYLYESIVYELIVKVVQESQELSSFVLRCADVPRKLLNTRPRLGQDGFFYSKWGELVVRGDGMDLGEFDSLLFGRQGDVLSVEAMISRNNLAGLVKEIHYKRHLLSLLFDRPVQFVVASAEDIAHTAAGQLLSREGGCWFARTAPIDDLLRKISLNDIENLRFEQTNIGKGVVARHVPITKTFSYRRIHDETRARLMDLLGSNGRGEAIERIGEEPLLARIVIGWLDREALRQLADGWIFTIRGSPIDRDVIDGVAHGVILVLRLPEMRPSFYFKCENPEAFAKFGPFKDSEFGCESVIFPWTTPYFFSLDNNREVVSPSTLTRVLESCVTPKVARPRINKRRAEEEERVIRRLFNMSW